MSSLNINTVSVCTSSRGCTPKQDFENDMKAAKHSNYMAAYKNAKTNIVTEAGKSSKHYVLMYVKGQIKIGKEFGNIAIRIPRSLVLTVTLGLSSQKKITVSKSGDNDIKLLINELTELIHKAIPDLKTNRKSKLNNLGIHGFNILDPTGGTRPVHCIKNFIDIMTLMDKEIKTHQWFYIPTEGKSVVKANFKPFDSTKYTSFGITQWLMCDFLGVKSIGRVIDLSSVIWKAFQRIKAKIIWDLSSKQPPTKRKKGTQKNHTLNNSNLILPKKTSDGQLYVQGHIQPCMDTSKKYLVRVARKLQLNPKGIRKDLCPRIMSKLEAYEPIIEPTWNVDKGKVYYKRTINKKAIPVKMYRFSHKNLFNVSKSKFLIF